MTPNRHGAIRLLGWWGAMAVLITSVADAQQKVDLRRAAAPDISLRLQGAFAAVRVVGWTKDSVVVTGTLPRGFRLDGGFGGASDSPSRGGKIFVESPDIMGAAGGALEVRVPVNATLWIKGSNATIEVSGVTGGLDLNVVGGSVQVTGDPRELSIATMDGTVVVNGSPTWTRLKSADGNITLRGGSTDAAFNTVSGTIHVSDGAFERARFETVTGGVEFFGDVARGAAITVDTHSGPVDVRVTPKVSVEVDAATITGSIENQVTRLRAVPGRDGRGASFAATWGQGSARLTIRTFKGSIRLSSR
jgi:hypothetical protein